MVVGLGGIFGIVWLNQQVLMARCPSGTFITGLSNRDEEREKLAFVAAFTVVMFFSWAILVRLWGNREKSNTRGHEGRFLIALKIDSGNKKLAFIGGPLAVVALSLAIPLSTFFPKYCLTDEAIFARPPSDDGMKRYDWNSIWRIDTACAPGARGSWQTYFTVTMRDGVNFNLMTAGRQVPAVYPRIVRALQGINFVYNYYGVENCGAPLRDVVINRP